MAVKRFNTDNPADVNTLKKLKPKGAQYVEALPRRTRYGSAEARRLGLTPIEDEPDVLIPQSDYKEALQYARDQQTMPIYHQLHTWMPAGKRWNQNGLGYCWTWGGTAALKDCRALEDKGTVQLAPVTMGWLVNWRNVGNYLESYIQGAREKGVAPASCVPDDAWHTPNPRRFDSCWENERAKYRLDKVWDTSRNDMLRHCLSILCYGRPLYIAYNWWGHALDMVGMYWDESESYNIVCQIRNSHNEDDVIELTGSRMIPDEAYGFASTVLTT